MNDNVTTTYKMSGLSEAEARELFNKFSKELFQAFRTTAQQITDFVDAAMLVNQKILEVMEPEPLDVRLGRLFEELEDSVDRIVVNAEQQLDEVKLECRKRAAVYHANRFVREQIEILLKVYGHGGTGCQP